MQMSLLALSCLALWLQDAACAEVSVLHKHKTGHKDHKGHHHHRHHRHHHHGHHHGNVSKPLAEAHGNVSKPLAMAVKVPMSMAGVKSLPTADVAGAKKSKQVSDMNLVSKMKALEQRLTKKQQEVKDGHILVMGPLPTDFSERFAQAVAHATGVDASKVVISKTSKVGQDGVFSLDFKAPAAIVTEVEKQSGEEDSKLARGNLHSFLADDGEAAGEGDEEDKEKGRQHMSHERSNFGEHREKEPKQEEPAPVRQRRQQAAKKVPVEHDDEEPTPVQQGGLDIDTEMPYGELEPFGREDTAQELTEDSISESNQMVDQLERAEVAEEKRSVFRALTRLRGAAITSFDGVARSQTGNIDEYNKTHKWRKTHPLHHLADEESDITKWAFPDNADF